MLLFILHCRRKKRRIINCGCVCPQRNPHTHFVVSVLQYAAFNFTLSVSPRKKNAKPYVTVVISHMDKRKTKSGNVSMSTDNKNLWANWKSDIHNGLQASHITDSLLIAWQWNVWNMVLVNPKKTVVFKTIKRARDYSHG